MNRSTSLTLATLLALSLPAFAETDKTLRKDGSGKPDKPELRARSNPDLQAKKIADLQKRVATLEDRLESTESEAEAGSSWSVTGGMDFLNAYYVRGIFQDDRGIIAQPYLELTLNVFDTSIEFEDYDDLSVQGDLVLGNWNSVHSRPEGDPSQPVWYQSDFYVGFNLTFAKYWHVDTSFILGTSPNNQAFSAPGQEINIVLSLDDDPLSNDGNSLGKSLWSFLIESNHPNDGISWAGLNPNITIAVETKSKSDNGNPRGSFLGLGVSPGIHVRSFDDRESAVQPPFAFDVRFPLQLGLSIDDYFESSPGRDATFGYLDVGMDVTIPMACIPGSKGQWNIVLKAHGLFLGNTLERLNNGRGEEFVGSAGFNFVF